MTGGGRRFLKALACPICLDAEIEPYKKATFETGRLLADQVKITDSEYGKVWDLSRCRTCGHIFADPCPRTEDITSLYSRVIDPQYEEEAEGRSRNFLRILDRLEKHVPEKGPLLDVGAATGILLHLARKRGWKPEGLEISAWAVQVAKEKYGLRLRQGDFEKMDLPRRHYKAVTMVDFIEHVSRPVQAADKAWRLLKPGGLLCLVTPDIHSLAARAAGRRWWHLRPGHLAYFSWRSLTLLLHRSGFRVIELRRYAWTFSLHSLMIRRPVFRNLAESGSASFLKRIPIKLTLGDSFEVYAKKVPRA